MSALSDRAEKFTRKYSEELGENCEIYTGESGVSQDDYGSVIGTGVPTIKARAYPLRWNPSEKELSRAGIAEFANALAYFPKSIMEYDSINTAFARVTINGETFRVSSKNRKDLNGIWTVLGLVRQ